MLFHCPVVFGEAWVEQESGGNTGRHGQAGINIGGILFEERGGHRRGGITFWPYYNSMKQYLSSSSSSTTSWRSRSRRATSRTRSRSGKPHSRKRFPSISTPEELEAQYHTEPSWHSSYVDIASLFNHAS